MLPTRMTRSEYEAQYGVAPVSSSSDLDINPAPIRMTRAEYNNLYRPQKKSYIQDFGADIAETGQAMKEAVNLGADVSGQIEQRMQSGETSTTKGLFQKFGTGLGTAANALFQGAFGAAKAVLPQGVEERVAETLGKDLEQIFAPETRQQFIDKLQQSEGGALLDTKSLDRKTGAFLQEVGEQYKNNEDFRTTVQAAGGITEWLALPSTTRAAVTRTADVVGDAASQMLEVKQLAQKATDNFANSRQDKRVQNVANEIEAIENKYAPTRRIADADPNVSESRLRIAQSNVLENAVNEDGLIRTKTKGGAVDAYRELTIDGVEDVVRRNLELEGKKMNLKELESDMRVSMVESGLEGADLTRALKGITNEIKGLAIRADEFGDILLQNIQDAKIATTRHIDYTKPTGVTYRKNIASTYRSAIERKSDLNVREINQELAKYYTDLERLSNLDGKRVKGGRLGRYTSQLAGSAIGGVAGSAGGAGGALAGGLIGGEVSAFLQGKAMQSTFRKGVRNAEGTRNPILDEAKARADAGVKDLSKPDNPVGASKALLDDPDLPQEVRAEILKKEGQIKNNIKQQKTAIKDGNFELVASLKEVYQILVAQLSDIIKAAKENLANPSNRQGGFVKNPLYRDRNLDQTNANTAPTNAQNISSKVPEPEQTVKADIEDSIVTENLMRLDPMEADPNDFSLIESLQRKAEKGPLSEDDLLDAQRIVEDYEGKLPEPEVATPTLEQQAKGMSKEEFIEAQTKGTVIHGSNKPIEGELKLNSKVEGVMESDDAAIDVLYVTPNTETGVTHSRMYTKQDGQLYTLKLSEKAKIFDYSNPEHRRLLEGKINERERNLIENNLIDGQLYWAAIPSPKKVKELGFDGMKQIERKAGDEAFDETFGTTKYKENAESIMLWNKDVFEQVDVPTRTQLEDIWEKANGKSVSKDLVEEARKYDSAEEFVNSIKNGTFRPRNDSGLIFRGEGSNYVDTAPIEKLQQIAENKSTGTYFAKMPSKASEYGRVSAYRTSKDFKLANKPTFYEYVKEFGDKRATFEAKIKSDGYSAYTNQLGEIVVLEPSKITKLSDSDLALIWKTSQD